MDKNSDIKESTGYVYVLKNRCFKEPWLQIGNTKDSLELELQTLSYGLPHDFEVVYTAQTIEHQYIAQRVHEALSEFRIDPDRRFFLVPEQQAVESVRDVLVELDPQSTPEHGTETAGSNAADARDYEDEFEEREGSGTVLEPMPYLDFNVMGDVYEPELDVPPGVLATDAIDKSESDVVAEPELADQPETIAELEAVVEPELTADHEPANKPQLVDQSEAIAEPHAAVEPEFTTDGEPAAEQDLPDQAESTAEPESVVVLELTAEPDLTDHPEAIAEPEAAVEPEFTADGEVASEQDLADQAESTVEPDAVVELGAKDHEAAAEPEVVAGTKTAAESASPEDTTLGRAAVAEVGAPLESASLDPYLVTDFGYLYIIKPVKRIQVTARIAFGITTLGPQHLLKECRKLFGLNPRQLQLIYYGWLETSDTADRMIQMELGRFSSRGRQDLFRCPLSWVAECAFQIPGLLNDYRFLRIALGRWARYYDRTPFYGARERRAKLGELERERQDFDVEKSVIETRLGHRVRPLVLEEYPPGWKPKKVDHGFDLVTDDTNHGFELLDI